MTLTVLEALATGDGAVAPHAAHSEAPRLLFNVQRGHCHSVAPPPCAAAGARAAAEARPAPDPHKDDETAAVGGLTGHAAMLLLVPVLQADFLVASRTCDAVALDEHLLAAAHGATVSFKRGNPARGVGALPANVSLPCEVGVLSRHQSHSLPAEWAHQHAVV
eukprot:CAMPEP_0117620592 /NCGR_PEP_ID=MMETSP0784-20121206/87205_1 /TAXON_ID=39447 /ORGANISM="" /LENGTH=162 /DNA_ID=CAMNT_0005424505 /DNA_START=117 /DNA_END=603 /DNA_ORIENTATION=-